MKEINKKRRNIIKFLLIGGGAFVLGRIFGPRLLGFLPDTEPVVEYNFKNFNVREDKKEIIISDSTGEDILIIDKRR